MRRELYLPLMLTRVSSQFLLKLGGFCGVEAPRCTQAHRCPLGGSLRGRLFLTCRVPHLGLWQHNITVVHETTRHALTAARVALDHDKVRLKDSHGDYGHRQFLMVGLLQHQHPVTLATLLVGHAVATIASLRLCLYGMKQEFVMHTTALKHTQAPSVQPPLQSESVVSQSADSSSLSDTR